MGNVIKYKTGDKVTVRLDNVPEFEATIVAKEQWNSGMEPGTLKWFLSLSGVKQSIRNRLIAIDDNEDDRSFTVWHPRDYSCIEDTTFDPEIGIPKRFFRRNYLWTLDKYFFPAEGLIAEESKILKEIYGEGTRLKL